MAVTLMRCHTTHWQGDNLVREGTMLPDGDKQVLPMFFEAVEFPDAEPPKKTATKKTT